MLLKAKKPNCQQTTRSETREMGQTPPHPAGTLTSAFGLPELRGDVTAVGAILQTKEPQQTKTLAQVPPLSSVTGPWSPEDSPFYPPFQSSDASWLLAHTVPSVSSRSPLHAEPAPNPHADAPHTTHPPHATPFLTQSLGPQAHGHPFQKGLAR